MNTYPDIVRYINVGLSLICIALLLRKFFLFWDQYQERTKDFWWVLMCWSLTICLGTTEILLGWDTNFRVLFTCGALLLTLKLMLKPNELEHPTFTNEF